jgi:hypothetical protein
VRRQTRFKAPPPVSATTATATTSAASGHPLEMSVRAAGRWAARGAGHATCGPARRAHLLIDFAQPANDFSKFPIGLASKAATTARLSPWDSLCGGIDFTALSEQSAGRWPPAASRGGQASQPASQPASDAPIAQAGGHSRGSRRLGIIFINSNDIPTYHANHPAGARVCALRPLLSARDDG